jgi:hypothetical protein
MFTLLSVEPSSQRDGAPDSEAAPYVINVSAGGQANSFWAEVRPGPRGDQIDWADEFQDLLLEHDILATDYGKIADIIHQVHCGLATALPATFGAA